MSHLATAFSYPWQVRMPQVVRYMEQEYVDAFFDDGSLRLSSFQACRGWEDDERGDRAEGRFDGNVGSMAVAAFAGETSYLLCTCAVENRNMDAKFDTSSGFRIVKPLDFARVVSQQIPGFMGGYQGLCSYRDHKFRQDDEELPEFDERQAEQSLARLESLAGSKMLDAMFIKDLRFVHQVEHRFIWVSQQPQEEFLSIRCPAAKQFCRPLRGRPSGARS